jgi:AcrR family transcriptional regulator
MPRETVRLRELKKTRCRSRIVEVAVDLVREQGYEKATVEEIVRRVEISQPTFYHYFSSKDAVLRAAADEALETWTAALKQEPIPKAGAAQALQRFYAKLADAMTADRALWQAIVLSDALNPVRLPEQRDADMVQRGYVESILAEGQQRGEITRKFSATRLAENLDALQFLACCAWGADYPPGRSLHELLAENLEMFLQGARTARKEKKR